MQFIHCKRNIAHCCDMKGWLVCWCFVRESDCYVNPPTGKWIKILLATDQKKSVSIRATASGGKPLENCTGSRNDVSCLLVYKSFRLKTWPGKLIWHLMALKNRYAKESNWEDRTRKWNNLPQKWCHHESQFSDLLMRRLFKQSNL